MIGPSFEARTSSYEDESSPWCLLWYLKIRVTDTVGCRTELQAQPHCFIPASH
uniref:Uncharacterized protein n=1 Tax=Alteromonadaceae bacterium PE-TB08W TaxID=1199097 RepID=A0A3G9DX72_9ALTE|nr:hypothetical protein (truncated) [Alteromonadaceae bacterium PE-TB08W]